MREKIVNVLNKIYGALIAISLFAGILPVIPFIVAIIIGGTTAEQICIFIYKEYYPYVIICATVAVIIGLIAMYINKHDFSVSKKKKAVKKEEVSSEEQVSSEKQN